MQADGEQALDPAATQRAHIRALLRDRRSILLGAISVLIATGVTGALAGAPWAILALAGSVLVVYLVFWVYAGMLSQEDFFQVYAAERGLEFGGGQSRLPPATTLLRSGSRSYGDATFAGSLAGRVDGVLSLWTYVTTYTDHEGDEREQSHGYTIALAEVPEARTLFHRLVFQPRIGPSSLDWLEDKFADRQRVEIESADLDSRAEIFIAPGDDLNRARELFSPSFIDWVMNHELAPGFEIENGWVATAVWPVTSDPKRLDALSEACAEVSERLAAEAREAGLAADPSQPPFKPRSVLAQTTEKRPPARRLSAALAWLAFTVAVFGAIAVGTVAFGEDDRDPNAPGSGDTPAALTNPNEEFDADMLSGIALYDKGNGASGRDVDGVGLVAGMAPAEIDAWIADATSRGLIKVTGGPGSTARISLTPTGEDTEAQP